MYMHTDIPLPVQNVLHSHSKYMLYEHRYPTCTIVTAFLEMLPKKDVARERM